MQKTTFRFEAIVHDDASTDSSVSIILEYANKYPDIIKPIYETDNQYSKHDGSLQRIMNEHTHGKYVAICEGDDYWTDPFKLQKQVDFLESYPDCSLCFHAFKEEFPKGKNIEVFRYKNNNLNCSIKDMILAGGGFMATNSMLYRRALIEPYPEWARQAPVGDLPLMLVLAYKGKVAYLSDVMSAYRVATEDSWSSRMMRSFSRERKFIHEITIMWKSFDVWTDKRYHSLIVRKIIKNYYNLYKNRLLYCVKKCVSKSCSVF